MSYLNISAPHVLESDSENPRRTTESQPSYPTSVISDQQLIDEIVRGDVQALSTLFSRYTRVVRSVVFKIIRDEFEVDDVTQDALLILYNKIAQFDRSKGCLRSWILQIAYNRAISRRRYLNCRHFYTALPLDEPDGSLQIVDIGAERRKEAVERELDRSELEKLFEGLSDNQRITLRLYFFEGYTFDEIAVQLSQTKQNIRHHYFRGLEKLRKLMFLSGPAR